MIKIENKLLQLIENAVDAELSSRSPLLKSYSKEVSVYVSKNTFSKMVEQMDIKFKDVSTIDFRTSGGVTVSIYIANIPDDMFDIGIFNS
jgi:hypothetical protein